MGGGGNDDKGRGRGEGRVPRGGADAGRAPQGEAGLNGACSAGGVSCMDGLG